MHKYISTSFVRLSVWYLFIFIGRLSVLFHVARICLSTSFLCCFISAHRTGEKNASFPDVSQQRHRSFLVFSLCAYVVSFISLRTRYSWDGVFHLVKTNMTRKTCYSSCRSIRMKRARTKNEHGWLLQHPIEEERKANASIQKTFMRGYTWSASINMPTSLHITDFNRYPWRHSQRKGWFYQ